MPSVINQNVFKLEITVQHTKVVQAFQREHNLLLHVQHKPKGGGERWQQQRQTVNRALITCTYTHTTTGTHTHTQKERAFAGQHLANVEASLVFFEAPTACEMREKLSATHKVQHEVQFGSVLVGVDRGARGDRSKRRRFSCVCACVCVCMCMCACVRALLLSHPPFANLEGVVQLSHKRNLTSI